MDDNWKDRVRAAEDRLHFFPAGSGEWRPQPGDKWPVPGYLQKSNARWAKVLTKIYRHPMSFPGSLSPQMGGLLRTLIMNIAPKNMVEIGSYLGASSIWMASAMTEYDNPGKLHCIDLFTPHTNNPWCPGVTVMDPYEYVLENIKKCRFEHLVELHRGDSRAIASAILKHIGEPVDFILIDGDHTVPGFAADFDNFEPAVATGGYILLHDVFPHHSDSDGPAFMLSSGRLSPEKYEVCRIYTAPLNFGFCLLRKIHE